MTKRQKPISSIFHCSYVSSFPLCVGRWSFYELTRKNFSLDIKFIQKLNFYYLAMYKKLYAICIYKYKIYLCKTKHFTFPH